MCVCVIVYIKLIEYEKNEDSNMTVRTQNEGDPGTQVDGFLAQCFTQVQKLKAINKKCV